MRQKKDKKTVLAVYLTENEKSYLDKRVKELGSSRSLFIRNLIIREQFKVNKTPRIKESDLDLTTAYNAIPEIMEKQQEIENRLRDLEERIQQ